MPSPCEGGFWTAKPAVDRGGHFHDGAQVAACSVCGGPPEQHPVKLRLPYQQRRAVRRAAIAIAEYSKMIRESEVYRSGPDKGRTDPEVWKEVLEYRAVIDQLRAIAA